MSRLREDLLERVDVLAHRVADVADALEKSGNSRRVVDRLYGCGTSIGANTLETSVSMSTADYRKGLGIVLKELADPRLWLRFVSKRGCITSTLLEPLESEAGELRLIYGASLARTKRAARRTLGPLQDATALMCTFAALRLWSPNA